jgi:hypothetical protein
MFFQAWLNYSSLYVKVAANSMSRQLRSLLKQNRLLEEKIFYRTDEPDWQERLIKSTELSEALTRLSSKIIDNQSADLSVLRMLNQMEKFKGRPLAAFEKNALQVVEILFNYLRQYSTFTTDYYHILNSLQLAFCRLSLNDLSYLDNPKHVAVQFLEKLMFLGQHFDKGAGKLADFFIQAIELLTNRLANQETVTNSTFVQAREKLDEYFDGFNDKTSANIGRVLSQIEKNSRVAEADQTTQQLIKSKIDGEEMPIFLLDFFENQLTAILHKTIATHGSQSKHCQQLLTDMDTLTWSITYPVADEEYKQRFLADVAQAMKRLYQHFEQADCFNEYVKEFFVEAESIHTKKLEGKRADYDVVISADIFADEIYGDEELDEWSEKPKNTVSFDINSLTEGDWYQVNQDNVISQVRLLSINHLTNELFFINLSGDLTATIAFDDNDTLFNHVTPFKIDQQVTYQMATDSLIRELTARLEILTKEHKAMLKNKAIEDKHAKEQEQQARIAVKQKIEEDKLRQAIEHQRQLEKIAKEQQALEAEEAKQLKRQQDAEKAKAWREKQRELEKDQKEEDIARQRFFVKSVLRKLLPGVMVAFQNEQGRWQEVSLTLISKTTQRYIFSDRRGAKALEPNKEELQRLITEQRLKVIKPAQSTHDPLQSLVKKRRENLSS